MKKLLLCAAVALMAFTANAQDGMFKVGASVGFPVGDLSEAYSLSAGLDVAYLFPVNDKFQLGAASGFVNVFGEDIETGFGITFEAEDAQFIPVAAAVRFMATDNLYVGTDIGYAVSAGEGDGGFYYRPRVGYSFTEMVGANVSYSGISSNGVSLNYVGVGLELSF
jgi:hypothetical protein